MYCILKTNKINLQVYNNHMLVKNIINTFMDPINLTHLTLECPVLVSVPCDILYVYDWIIKFILKQLYDFILYFLSFRKLKVHLFPEEGGLWSPYLHYQQVFRRIIKS